MMTFRNNLEFLDPLDMGCVVRIFGIIVLVFCLIVTRFFINYAVEDSSKLLFLKRAEILWLNLKALFDILKI